jgi:hypothetical protein
MVIEKGFSEVSPSLIELFVANGHFLVGFNHINTFVIVGSSSNQGDEVGLSLALFVHVGVLEVILDDWVIQHVDIELIDD